MRGVSLQTGRVLQHLATADLISNYTLIGGTALSLSLGHRLSEDLDFCMWDKSANELNLTDIISAVQGVIPEGQISVLLDSPYQKDLVAEGVKITFFKDRAGEAPTDSKVILGRVNIASILAIGGIKACVTLSRAKFRDYYDIFSILVGKHASLPDILGAANNFKPHLNPRLILQNILSLSDVPPDDSMNLLKPIYNISPDEIQLFIRQLSSPAALNLNSNLFEQYLGVKRNDVNFKFHQEEEEVEFRNKFQLET